jgi:hypothetical protein
MKHLIPHGRHAEFRIFLQEKYGILLDEVGDDVDITDKISDFIYGNKEETTSKKEVSQEVDVDKIGELYRSKISKDMEGQLVEVVWFEAVRKNVGDTIFVVEAITTNETIRFIIKDKDESMKMLKKISGGMCDRH